MSRENVEIVRKLVDDWNRRNIDGFLDAFDPECEVVFRPDVPEPSPFRGQDALKGWIDGFLAAWEFHRAELVEVADAGDEVFVTLLFVGRGTGSGIAMDDTEGHVFTIRAGKIVRWRGFRERAEALKAAGLSASDG